MNLLLTTKLNNEFYVFDASRGKLSTAGDNIVNAIPVSPDYLFTLWLIDTPLDEIVLEVSRVTNIPYEDVPLYIALADNILYKVNIFNKYYIYSTFTHEFFPCEDGFVGPECSTISCMNDALTYKPMKHLEKVFTSEEVQTLIDEYNRECNGYKDWHYMLS